MVLLKRFFFLAIAIHLTLAVKPPNYIEKPKVPDKYPPKYEYNYFVANRHTQAAQGHKEIRNGDFTRGNYFVNLPKGESKTTVNYIADEWGFFPVTRYYNRGPHHRVSGHFALGQHAVERLNETNLNTNEVFFNQSPENQHAPVQQQQYQQQQAQATFPTAQVVFNPKQSIDNKPPLNNIYAPNQPHHDHQQQQQSVFQSPGAFHNQQIPLMRNQEKNASPLIFQRAQQMPLIYQYAQQHAPPQISYYYQQKPQEVIYHQQPIVSMAPLQEHQQQQQESQQNQQEQQQDQEHVQLQQEQQQEQQQQQQQQQFVFVDEAQQFSPEAHLSDNVGSNNGNINVNLPQAIPQEINSREEILPPQLSVNGNLIQVQPEAASEVTSDNQKQAKLVKDFTSAAALSQEELFQSPIVVGEQQINFLPNNESEAQTIVVQQKPNQGPVIFQNYQPPQKQFNIQILTDVNAQHNADQYLRETSVAPKIVNGHTNSNNYQYLVEGDQDLLDSTPSSKTEAPSRQFLKKFKNFRTYEQSTIATSYSTSTSRTITKVTTDGGCCKDNTNSNCCKNDDKTKTLEITQRPLSNSFLAPVHAGIRLTNENLEDCVDGHTVKPVVEAQENDNVVVLEQQLRVPVYGDRIVVSSTPATRVVTQPIRVTLPPAQVAQPIFIERPQKTAFIQQPTFIEKQHLTEVVHQPIYIEKPVIKEVQVPVEKPVWIQSPPKYIDRPVYIKSPPETKIVEKIVHQPVEVEKIVEKIVDRPYYIKSPPETRIVKQQVFVEKPVTKEVHVPVEKTVYVQSPPKYIDRPVYIKSPPETKIVEKIVHQPVEVEKIVEKIVDRPYYIKSAPETKIVQQQVFVEKPVIKEVQVPVEKTVYVQSPPETKIIHHPVIQTVEKPVYIEKIVQQPYEVEKIVEKFIDRPVIQTVEKIVDRPVEIEKFIDRPYPVPYAVAIPYEKHIYHNNKPDFHVYAKSIPQKPKLFDFDALFGFLSKKKEVKHIFVPSSHQHQLKQLNQHHLIKSTLTTIDPVQESPVFDYSRYATTHLNPIKPIYGVPSTPLAPVNTGYSYPNPYAGNFNYDQVNPVGVGTIASGWTNDNLDTQSQQSQVSSHQVPAVHRDNYVGPTPLSEDYWAINGVQTKEGIKFRRNAENGRSFRIEYGGFHPKMSPSVEIDQNGMPLKKEEN